MTMVVPNPTAEAVLTRLLNTLPVSEHALLILDGGSQEIPASAILDPEWVEHEMHLRSERWQVDDPLILGTVLWRAISSSLVLPTVASLFVTGTALSPRLQDVVLHRRALTGRDVDFVASGAISTLDGTFSPNRKMYGRLVGARSTRVLTTPVESALAEALGSGIEYLASLCGKGERRLWAVAVDSIATRYLWAGTATGRVDEALESARATVREISGQLGGTRLPAPRFQEVATESEGAPHTFVHRVSCCLLYNGPHGVKCSTCPRQHPDVRLARLSERARRLGR
ncbi:(2Fe-2S)-binding protein [Rhodococcus rhodochrous]|nr:(2Fe-2S)-binding protein [Rhodococcus rhodochrous]MDJ0399033.1 (2Fe-2S)-binding protein [Rhodococcus rhodochrous]